MLRVVPARSTVENLTPINCWRSGEIRIAPGGRVGVASGASGPCPLVPVASSAYTGSSVMPQSGATPGLSDVYAGCIGST
jgi:hypothetical protein